MKKKYWVHILLITMISIIISCTSYDEMLDALESKQGINKLKKGIWRFIKVV